MAMDVIDYEIFGILLVYGTIQVLIVFQGTLNSWWTRIAIGFLVFVPFLVVDLVVSNVLLALGLTQLSPTSVALPFKLLLFVAVDGWKLLARALALSYAS